MRILSLDIETLPMVAFCWGLRDDYNTHENIIQDWSVVSVSWQWIGEKKIHSVSILDSPTRFRTSVYDDTHVVTKFHGVMEKADVYLGQNIDRFDIPVLNSRILKLGLRPLNSKESIDTLKASRRAFRLPSHRLDYRGRFFLGQGKMDTGGMKLWRDIAQLDYPQFGEEPDVEKAKKAVRKMVKYNRRDVKLTGEDYEQIRPYIKKHPNARMYNSKHDGCARCGSDNVVAEGVKVRRSGKFQQWRCKGCGGWFSSSISEVKRDHISLG